MEAICQYGSFSKVGHANGGEPGNARWTAVAASFCRPGHRHLGGVGLRPLDFRIVAMEAIYLTKAGFQSRTYMEANQRNARWTATVAFAVLSRWRRSVLRGQFSEVGRKWWCRGQPSSGRWRQEHAAGEAAQRMSALSGIGAGKYESVATAAGGDDADNSSPGGFSPSRHRFTDTCGACDVSHLSCVHGLGGAQDSDGDRLTNTCPMWIPSGVLGGAQCSRLQRSVGGAQ